MSPRFGFRVLFGLIIILMQEKATRALTYDDACTADAECDTPADTLVCELTSATAADHKCKIKNGASCASHTDKCVDGAACDGTSNNCVCATDRTATPEGKCPVAVGGDCSAGKTCATDLVCENDLCKIKSGESCASHTDKCVDGATCDGTSNNCACGTGRTPATPEGKCSVPVAVGGDCSPGKTCATDLVCENDLCKIKNGTNCTGHENDCVDGATCTGTTNKQCTCQSWRSPAANNGSCAAVPGAGAAGGPCATSTTTCTGTGFVCEDNICKLKHGADCTLHVDLCVKNAACLTTGNCTCDSTKFSASEQGVCTDVSGKNGAPSLLASLLFVVGLLMTPRLL